MESKGQAVEKRALSVDHERLLRSMLTLRLYEGKLKQWYAGKVLGGSGSYTPYAGQEACAAGICTHLRREDALFGGHRSWAHSIAKGVDLYRFTAELFARRDGYAGGRGGRNAFSAPEEGVLLNSGYVGDTIPIAAGAALAAKKRGKGEVVVAFFGDGAINTGAYHEGLNLAAVWRLPVVFACEDNQRAFTTSWDQGRVVYSIAERASGYGMPGVTLDGNDVLAVHEAAGEAVRRARAGEGPTLLDLKTFSVGGHAAFLPPVPTERYSKETDVEEWKKKDPIDRLVARLTEGKIMSIDQIQRVHAEIAETLEKVEQAVLASPHPDVNQACSGVYFAAPAGSGKH